MGENIILTVRAMTPKESNEFSKKMAELMAEYPSDPKNKDEAGNVIPNPKVIAAMVEWVMDAIYPGTKDELYCNEQAEIFSRTIELSNQVRYDRIKNLKAPSNGSMNGADSAKPAEK